jgi:hypothetical protein
LRHHEYMVEKGSRAMVMWDQASWTTAA